MLALTPLKSEGRFVRRPLKMRPAGGRLCRGLSVSLVRRHGAPDPSPTNQSRPEVLKGPLIPVDDAHESSPLVVCGEAALAAVSGWV